MKILFLTKYDGLAASSRLRAYQYQNKMDSSKFEVDVKPLLSAFYLGKKFKDKKELEAIAGKGGNKNSSTPQKAAAKPPKKKPTTPTDQGDLF